MCNLLDIYECFADDLSLGKFDLICHALDRPVIHTLVEQG